MKKWRGVRGGSKNIVDEWDQQSGTTRRRDWGDPKNS